MFDAGAAGKVFAAVAKRNHKSRKPGGRLEREGVRGMPSTSPAEDPPTDLHLASRSSLTDMAPGDFVFLDDFAHLREAFAPNFVAVLACPLCGAPGLITTGQFFAGAPIVCTSKVCSGWFRIVGESQILSLPPN